MDEEVNSFEVKSEPLDVPDPVEDPLAPRLSDYMHIRPSSLPTKMFDLNPVKIGNVRNPPVSNVHVSDKENESEVKEESNKVTKDEVDIIEEVHHNNEEISQSVRFRESTEPETESILPGSPIQDNSENSLNNKSFIDPEEDICSSFGNVEVVLDDGSEGVNSSDSQVITGCHHVFASSSNEAVPFPEPTEPPIWLSVKILGEDHFGCTMCDYQASVKSYVLRHFRGIHGIKRYACEICDYKTSEEGILKRHVRTVHPGSKPYSCEKCDYRSSERHVLKKHVRIVHQGIKPYPCEFCDYNASENSDLRKHVRAVHEGIKPYACEMCDYKAKYKSVLTRHVQTIHQGMKPFACDICDYKAGQKATLDQHVKHVHQGIKPHVCDICGYKAGVRSNLLKHIQIVHRGVKPYVCEICNYTAGEKRTLERHYLRHEKMSQRIDQNIENRLNQLT